MKPKVIAITMGDPAGIGPEVLVKALDRRPGGPAVGRLVIGDLRVIEQASRTYGVSLPVRAVRSPDEVDRSGATIDVLDLANVDPAGLEPGRLNATAGRAAMEAIERAARMALAGEVAAITTAPIHKEATRLGGYDDIGHLEFLARLTRAREYATMLVSGRLRTVHLTTHHSLRKACDLVTKDRIVGKLQLTHDAFLSWGRPAPRIAVAALNPHGGEGGLFGDEEIREIGPAVEAARAAGIDARGPYPADSVFTRAIGGLFDAVLAMYHDQGHIPVKVHGVEESVSVAMGLPLVRTSVDHGTAFDIAGKGIADPRSMVRAIEVAVGIVERRWPEPTDR